MEHGSAPADGDDVGGLNVTHPEALAVEVLSCDGVSGGEEGNCPATCKAVVSVGGCSEDETGERGDCGDFGD